MVISNQLNKLTPREIEILQLLTREHTSAQIARLLNISEYTVESHRRSLLKKTNTKSVIGLVTFALRNKIT